MELTLQEVLTLAVTQLVAQGKLKADKVDANWHFNQWTPEKSYVSISQED